MFEEKNWEPEFTKRLEKHYDELKWLYAELYNNDQQAFAYFVDMLYSYYSQRSEVLKQWDQMREEVPEWYKGNEMLGMLMYTNCFAGTLQAFVPQDMLDSFQAGMEAVFGPGSCQVLSIRPQGGVLLEEL